MNTKVSVENGLNGASTLNIQSNDGLNGALKLQLNEGLNGAKNLANNGKGLQGGNNLKPPTSQPSSSQPTKTESKK